MVIILICAATWLVFASFVYLIENDLRLANVTGLLGAAWVGAILLTMQMVGG